MKARFDKARIEAARKELEECGGYIVPMPLGVADDDCFYSIGGRFGDGVVVFTPNSASSRYCWITYYVKPPME